MKKKQKLVFISLSITSLISLKILQKYCSSIKQHISLNFGQYMLVWFCSIHALKILSNIYLSLSNIFHQTQVLWQFDIVVGYGHESPTSFSWKLDYEYQFWIDQKKIFGASTLILIPWMATNIFLKFSPLRQNPFSIQRTDSTKNETNIVISKKKLFRFWSWTLALFCAWTSYFSTQNIT